MSNVTYTHEMHQNEVLHAQVWENVKFPLWASMVCPGDTITIQFTPYTLKYIMHSFIKRFKMSYYVPHIVKMSNSTQNGIFGDFDVQSWKIV